MSDVPPDALVNILSRLPVKSLLRCRSLSKTERALIDSPHFVNLHTKQSMKTDKLLVSSKRTHSSTSFRPLNLDSPQTSVELETPFDTTRFPNVLGTCHGLVCLSNLPFDRFIVLWNPATQKYKVILTPMVYPSSSNVLIAFNQVGYDHVNDDYKVVRLIQTGGYVWLNSMVFVYSLKLNMWRSVEQRFPYYFNLALCQGQGVCVNSALHWVVSKKPHLGNDLLVSFDLASQSFQLVPHPECFNSDMVTSLGVLGGCLCVVGYRELRSIDVWVMGEYGVKESWSKLVALTLGNVSRCVFLSVRPITYLKNGKEVVLEVNQQWFEIYDIEKKTSRQIMIGDASRRISTYVYQETLVRL
ncbi:putative F-box domain-containing protein [Helianthus annuus]|nr:putative F-box domain-containing protein [Helianthus annuus]